jgi:hypothetical protein
VADTMRKSATEARVKRALKKRSIATAVFAICATGAFNAPAKAQSWLNNVVGSVTVLRLNHLRLLQVLHNKRLPQRRPILLCRPLLRHGLRPQVVLCRTATRLHPSITPTERYTIRHALLITIILIVRNSEGEGQGQLRHSPRLVSRQPGRAGLLS